MTKTKKSAKTIKPAKPEKAAPVTPIKQDAAFLAIGGLSAVQARLHTNVILPLRNPKSVQRLGVKPARGILLYGPPGTGNSMLAAAVARAADAQFHCATASHIVSQYYAAAHTSAVSDATSNPIADLFASAMKQTPAILFIDELDMLAPPRGKGIGDAAVMDQALNDLVCAIDTLAGVANVLVMAATHRPNMIDPVLMNPGRFDELVYVPVPDAAGRTDILQKMTAAMPLAKDVDLAALAAKAERFTGADLEDVVRRAGLNALARSVTAKSVTVADFDTAMADSRASVTADMEKEYEAVAGQIKQAIVQPIDTVGFIAPGMVKSVRAEKHGTEKQDDVRD